MLLAVSAFQIDIGGVDVVRRVVSIAVMLVTMASVLVVVIADVSAVFCCQSRSVEDVVGVVDQEVLVVMVSVAWFYWRCL